MISSEFNSLFETRRNFQLLVVTRCIPVALLPVADHSLLNTHCKIACHALQKQIVRRYKNHLLLSVKFIFYLLRKLFVEKDQLLLVAEITPYKNRLLLVTYQTYICLPVRLD